MELKKEAFKIFLSLEEDKKLKEREYARMPKPQELEKLIQDLSQQLNDMQREIMHNQEQLRDVRHAIDGKNKENEQKSKDLKELLEIVENKKSEYVKINYEPNQIMKEADKISQENE